MLRPSPSPITTRVLSNSTARKIHDNRLSPLESPPCEKGVLNELVSGDSMDCNQESVGRL